MTIIRAHGLNYHVEQRGVGDTLFLLHGFTGSSASWWPVIDRLAETHHTVAIDLIGHGKSDAPRNGDRYTYDRVVDDLAEIAAQLGVVEAPWLGYSLGGRLALGLALQRPRLVSALVLASASPGIDDLHQRAARRRADEALARRIEHGGVAAFVAEWERLPMWAPQQSLPPPVLARQRAVRLGHAGHGLANSLRGMGQGIQPSHRDRLGEIQMPTLLIAGALDAKYVHIAGRMRDPIADAILCVAAGVGHAVHLEAPEFFAEQVLHFLAASGRAVAVAGEEFSS